MNSILGQTKEVRCEQSWVWLQNGDFKMDTEILIVTAQNQSIRTNLVKAKQEIKLEISGMNISQKGF